MISAGDFSLDLSRIKPFHATVNVDLDKSPRGPLPNASNQPLENGAVMADDQAYIRFEEITSAKPENGRVMAVRVQGKSEIEGLFGKEGGGWSKYSIVIEESGLAYAQIVHDGSKGIYGEIYNLNSERWGGAAERALDIAVEMIAGYELAASYETGANPLFRLAAWIQKNPQAALSALPADRLDAVLYSPEVGEALVDIDHDNKAFEPSVNIVLTHGNTAFAAFDAVHEDRLRFTENVDTPFTALCTTFQSEVAIPEYGQEPPAGQKQGSPDPMAPRKICFTTAGIKVFDPASNSFVSPSTGNERFLLNASVALVALGAMQTKLPLSAHLKKAVPGLKTDIGKDIPTAKELPAKDQITFDKWDGIGDAAWGGS